MSTLKVRHDPRPAAHVTVKAHRIRSPLATTTYGLRPDNAHLLLLETGRGQVGGDTDALTFRGPRMVWLTSRRAGTLQLSPGSRGELLELSGAAVAAALPASAFGAELSRVLRSDLALPLDAERERLSHWLAELRSELNGNALAADLMSDHILSLLLIQLWRVAKSGRPRTGAVTGGLVQDFIQLAGLRLHEHWQVADYAAALGVTRDRLSSSLRRATGKSPQQWLHDALHREAVELLTNSGLQVSQVGFRLGFSDPAYFNRFFTRMEGTPPSRFRRRTAKRSDPPTSYSAWP